MDIDSIKEQLIDVRRQTTEGFYAEIVDIEEHNETIILTVSLPDGGTAEHRLSIPTYWESGRELVKFLDNINVDIDSFEQIMDRALPVERVNGSWKISDKRIESGDVLTTSIIDRFVVTDNTEFNTVKFSIDYSVTAAKDADTVMIDINSPHDWADNYYMLDELSGVFEEYEEGGATGEYTITLYVLNSDGDTIESEAQTVVAE